MYSVSDGAPTLAAPRRRYAPRVGSITTDLRTPELTIRITLDTSFLDEWQAFERLFPYAIARALNKTAKRAGRDLRMSLTEYFTIRNKWTAGGIGMPKDPTKWASKDWQGVEVGAAQDYMRAATIGAHGGHTRPEGKQPEGAIPAPGIRAALGTGGRLSKKSLWPKALVRSKKGAIVSSVETRRRYVVATDKLGHGIEPGRPIWWLTTDASTQIDPVWPMEDIVRKTFAEHWAAEGKRSIRAVIKRAKKHLKEGDALATAFARLDETRLD